jgi:YidC/Oxa1 family membrane protein insertase
MFSLFHEILYRPLFNLLVFLYNHITQEDLGLAIILLTIIIRFILLPIFYKSAKNQVILQRLQPEIAQIQRKHKEDKQKQMQMMLDLYKTHQVNPFAGFLMLFMQLPILIVLYQIILKGFSPETLQDLYGFISSPEHINNSLLGLIDLGSRSMIITSLAVISQYFQGKISLPKFTKEQKMELQTKIISQMVFIGPILTLIILQSLPAAIGLYWLTTSIFSLVQQVFINKAIAAESRSKNHELRIKN